MPEQTGTSGEQCPGMQTFRTLGFELADISKSILLAEAPVMNRIASVEECHRLLKVSTFVMELFTVYPYRPSVENLNGCHKDIRATYSILSKKGTRQERLQWSAVISTYCIHRACLLVCREGFG